MYKNYTQPNYGPHWSTKKLLKDREASRNLIFFEFKKWTMRISIISLVMLLSLLNIHADSMAQRITIKQKNVSLRKVLREINRQTGYHYIWSSKTVHASRTVHVDIEDMQLEKALSRLFEGVGVSYSIDGKLILVKERSPITPMQSLVMLNINSTPVKPEELQQPAVIGRIVDQQGRPLAGASVKAVGRRESTMTNANGQFVLENVPYRTILQISYLGFKPLEIAATANLGTVVMAAGDDMLKEVNVAINTGYQSLPRERMTGSFSYVSGARLESTLATNLKYALEGQASGVVLDKKGNIEVRGVSTFTAEKSPLVVVDGYPIEGTIDNINPTNINSITILKDGVAASIYGSRAANGVIIITTKSGVLGKPTVSYTGFVSMTAKPNLKNLNRSSTSDYIDAEIDLFNLDPNGPSTISRGNMSRVTYLLMQVREKKITKEVAMAEINQLRSVDGVQQIQDHFFRNEITHQHNIGVMGGSESYSYNAAVNLQKNNENMIHSGSDRLIVDLKNEWRPFSFLTAGATANIVMSNSERPLKGFGNLLGYSSGSMLQPYTNLLDESGQPANIWGLSQYKQQVYSNTPGMKGWLYNPLEDLELENVTTKDFQTRLNGYVRVDLLKGLRAEVGGNWQRGSTQIKQYRDVDSYAVRIAYNDATSIRNNSNHYLPDGSIIDENRNINENWTVRTQLYYNRDFAQQKHRVNALVGNEIRRITQDYNEIGTRVGYNATAGSFVPMNLKDYNAGQYNADMLLGRQISLKTGEYIYRDNRFVSWYGNGSYEYDNRFILSGSIRMDLTNFFGTDEKYRYRPLWSLGGTYKLKNESFFQVPWVDKLNVRASYGINGNISLNQGPFLILSTGAFDNTTGGVSYGIASPPNNELRWEKTQISNVGVDFSLWNYRVDASIDYYHKNSTDLLASDAVDLTTGFASVTKNAGEMSNSGVELALNVDAIRRDKFRWSIRPNFAYNFNNVKAYNVTRAYAGSYATATGIMVAGYPANGLWGYRFAGLSDKGETQIYTGDGEIIRSGDATTKDVIYQGTLRPKFDLALTNRFVYRQWDLSFMFIAKLGHKYRKDGFSGSNYLNRHVAERWRKPGDEANTIYPVLQSWNMDMFDFPYIDRLVGNASYMKLRDVTLSYDLTSVASRMKMKNARVYLQGRNLFRVTGKGVDIDPETAEVNETGGTGAMTEQGYTSLPLPAQIFVGLSFSF